MKVKKTLFFPLIAIILSGCSSTFLLQSSPVSITKDDVTYILQPYTSKLNGQYGYGMDYTNTAENTSFILEVINDSDKTINISSAIKAALIDNFGYQYSIVEKPSLPSLDPQSRKNISSNEWWLLKDQDNMDRNIGDLINKEAEISGYLDNIESNTVTQNPQMVEELLLLRKDLVRFERFKKQYYLERRLAEQIDDSYQKVRFKGGLLYPEGKISGLLVFSPLSDEITSVKIVFPANNDNLSELIEYKFTLEKN